MSNALTFETWREALAYYRKLVGRALIRPVIGGYAVFDGIAIDRQIKPPGVIAGK